MKTYLYTEKNGCATLTINADNEDDAHDYLKDIVKYPDGFRLDDSEDEE